MMRRMGIALALAIAVCAAGRPARADVKLHALFGDGMVLQQGTKCPVWGSADPGEKVRVSMEVSAASGKVSAAGSDVSTEADNSGKWRVDLPLQPEMTGGPHQLVIKGKNTVTLKNVYVGEVWICSGQSNMEWPLSLTQNSEKTIAQSHNPKIRLFTVVKATSLKPRRNVIGTWQECTPETVRNFSAVGYFFGRDLQKARKVPIGLIHSSWGGTVAEAWTARHALEAESDLKYMVSNLDRALSNYSANLDRYLDNLSKYVERAKQDRREGKEIAPPPPFPAKPGQNPNTPSVLYNAMIKPLQPFAFRGVIWYQGESNAGRAFQYRHLFPTMIRNWRHDWKQSGEFADFPFLFVQLAPWQAIVSEPQESAWAELREAQLLTSLHLKNTGMAVITDVGDPKDIHPRKKAPVGARLARAARAIAYGEKIEYSGPLYDTMTVRDGKAVLSFKHVGKGLEAKGGALRGFTIAGEDRKFHNAQAEIQGETVLVWSDAVTQPAAVRYGWANCPVVNLWNKDGLPASPFRTDDYPMLTGPKSGK